MKQLPEVGESLTRLYNTQVESLRHKLLMAGIELKVFNELTKPGSAEDVARAIGSHPENTGYFLDGLAAMGLLTKTDGLYENSPEARAFLVEGGQVYLGEFLSYQSQWSAPAQDNMVELVREGPPKSVDMDVESEDMWAYGAFRMANYQKASSARDAVDIVTGLPEFPSMKRMLDLGGGPGLICIAVVGAHPSLTGVVFDRTAVVEVAEGYIKEHGAEGRVEVLGGDFNKDPIGEGYDLIWSSAALNFAKDNIDHVISKIYEALNPGGVFINVTDGLTSERTEPEVMVLSWMAVWLMGRDMAIERGFIADAMLRAGFRSVKSNSLQTAMGLQDVDIARKQ